MSQPRRSSVAPLEQPVASWTHEQGSKRWLHFQSALRLAIHRVSHQWTYEDFSLCFPLLCEEQPEDAGVVYDDVRQYMQTLMENNVTIIFDKYGLRPRVDDCFTIVQDARARARSDTPYTGSDVWRPDIPPRTLARARTVPVLETERDRLQAELKELEDDTAALQTQIQENVNAKEAAKAETNRILDTFDSVCAQWDDHVQDDDKA